MGIEEVVFRGGGGFADEIDTTEITGGCVTLDFCDYVTAIQQARCLLCSNGFTGTDTLRVISVLCRWQIVGQQADLLVETVSISFHQSLQAFQYACTKAFQHFRCAIQFIQFLQEFIGCSIYVSRIS